MTFSSDADADADEVFHYLQALDQKCDMFNHLPMAAYVVRADGVVVWYNARAAELWGRKPAIGDTDERFCGAHTLFHPDGTHMAHCDTPVALALSTGASVHEEEVIIGRPDGSRVHVSVYIDPIRNPRDGRTIGVVNYFNDLTERKRREAEREQLFQEAERCSAELREVREELESKVQLLGRCVTETRTLSHLLHPPLLEEAGFASAARDYVEEFARRSGIETDISLDLPYRLPGDTEILLFRVLQESLTNIHRHSGSNRAKIRAGMDGEVVSLEIRDYGHGISAEVLENFTISGNGVGVGLAGIRERLREVDGKLELSSTKDGTILRVSLLVTNTREPYRVSAVAN